MTCTRKLIKEPCCFSLLSCGVGSQAEKWDEIAYLALHLIQGYKALLSIHTDYPCVNAFCFALVACFLNGIIANSPPRGGMESILRIQNKPMLGI